MNAEEFQWNACLEQIVAWYAGSRRVLPWREDRSPYQVWVSEIMLQQTRIEAVIPYYHRFLAALPTVADLAAVEDEKLMKLWEGLGYYSRARNLKKAAQRILSDFGGELPATAAELKSLPGIGDYTAGAIASIAFGQPEPAVDGNVLRVMTRLLAWDADVASPKTKAEMIRLLRQHYPGGEAAGLLTEGIMELGETLCSPNGEARCELCPVRRFCRARLSGPRLGSGGPKNAASFCCAAETAMPFAAARPPGCWPDCGNSPARRAPSSRRRLPPCWLSGACARERSAASAEPGMSSPMWSGTWTRILRSARRPAGISSGSGGTKSASNTPSPRPFASSSAIWRAGIPHKNSRFSAAFS